MKKLEVRFTELYIDHLHHLYSGEKQFAKTLVKMAKAATSKNLKQAFLDHAEETHEQIERLITIFIEIARKPEGKKCVAMRGFIKEIEGVIKNANQFGPAVTDAALLAATQCIKNYELCAYGTAKCFAELLGFGDAATLLGVTQEEETTIDRKLNRLAKNEINPQALGSQDEEAEVEKVFGDAQHLKDQNGSVFHR